MTTPEAIIESPEASAALMQRNLCQIRLAKELFGGKGPSGIYDKRENIRISSHWTDTKCSEAFSELEADLKAKLKDGERLDYTMITTVQLKPYIIAYEDRKAA